MCFNSPSLVRKAKSRFEGMCVELKILLNYLLPKIL